MLKGVTWIQEVGGLRLVTTVGVYADERRLYEGE